MCDAASREPGATRARQRLRANSDPQLVPKTGCVSQESDKVRLLNKELLQRVQADSDANKAETHEKEQIVREASSRFEALARQHEDVLEDLAARLSMESQKSESLATKLEDLQQCRKADAVRSSEWVEKLREDCHELRERNQGLHDSNLQLKEEIGQLRSSLGASVVATKTQSRPEETTPEPKLEAKPETTPEVEPKPETTPEATCSGSESRLRAALTGREVPTEELRAAIASVEALLSEAKRELAARDLRDRRAAYERLHAAAGGAEEQPLEEAIHLARQSGVGEEDIEKAEAKLQELRSMTHEERVAQAAAKRLTEAKRRAFQLVKRGEAAALKELLRGFEMEGSGGWRGWKDHAGRSLLAYAKEARSEMVKECLQRMLAPPPSTQPESSSSAPEVVTTSEKLPKSPGSPPPATPGRQPRRAPALKEECATPAISEQASPSLQDSPAPGRSWRSIAFEDAETPLCEASTPMSARTRRACSFSGVLQGDADEETAALKVVAFRAVVKDDTQALHAVLERLPRDVWSLWHNKAGRDLLTLSQERRATGCYVMLCRAFGILQERKREAFMENETVWILSPGEVQPRHATVLEDTSSDDEDVLVEFWDAEGPPERVEHCLVLKAN